MTFFLKIFLLASLMFVASSAEARVHRRNVGPVILDLGNLPSSPVTTGDSQPPVGAGNLPSSPQVDGAPETEKATPEPVAIMATYPSHIQPLGALLLTIHSPNKPAEDIGSSLLFADLEPEVPVVIAYYHPTLAGDYAQLSPPVETTPTPAATAEPPPVEPDRASGANLRIDAETAPPVDRLRTLVVWVWRLLFFIGFCVLAVTLVRRRRRQTGQPVTSPPFDDVAEPEFSQDFVRSGILQEIAANPESPAESLSLRTEKSGAIARPESALRAFGLIEPGAARSARARAGAIRDKDRR